MIRIFTIGLLCAALLAPVETAAADGKRLTTETEFRELVVDRELIADRTTVLYTGDGQIAGSSRDEKIKGMWRWAGNALCRTVTLGTKSLGLDCQAVFVIGDLVVLVRDGGLGLAFALRIRRGGSPPGEPGQIALL